jgi:AcrR family transcriptional regulator
MEPRTGQGSEGHGRNSETLTRNQVLDAALEMVEAGGSDSLTVRGLATKLSVAVTSIYWHVGDKDALLDGVAERIISGFGHLPVRGSGPEARLRSVARALRRDLLERADLVALVHQRGRAAELLQPARRLIVGELVDAGVTGRRAAVAAQAIVNYVVASVLLDRPVERQPMQREAPEELWTADDLRDVPGAPQLLAALSRPIDDEAVFKLTLDALVEAVITR